jgi:branched-chain amino acid aminotransferase/4-amino-4-deoxychorismate lyase
MIPEGDRGLTLGDGLFETVLARDAELVWWEEHCARLTAGCEVLGLPAPEEAVLRAQATSTLAQAGLTAGRAAVRITWTAGSGGRGLDRPEAPAPRLIVTAAPAPLPSGPARLALSAIRRNEGSPASRLKTLSYLDNVMARTRARESGADEAVMLNNRGELACAAAANLFWIEGGRLETPALQCGVLAGVARARTIAAALVMGVEVAEVAAPAARLARAQAAFLTNSLIGVRPAAGFEEAVFGPSALTDALSRSLWL